jgi:hypothetical protein
MNQFAIPRQESSLTNHEDYVAAEVRNLFRTIDACDAPGVNECLDQIGSYLENWLFIRLLDTDQRWQEGIWWIDGISTRPAAVILPKRLRMRGSAYMALIQDPPPPQEGKFDCALYEPFEFEMDLCPKTGMLERYRLRFGDDRPLAEKRLGEPIPDELPAHRRWIFTFYRHCTEAEWYAHRSAPEIYTQVGSAYEDLDDDTSRAGTIARFARRTAMSARLLVRAEKANDSAAYEICVMDLRHQLLASLSFHMRVDTDYARSGTKWVQRLGDALPDAQIPNHLILRDEAVVYHKTLEPYPEPVEFDIELCPQSGEMVRYTYRFGKKKQTSAATSSGDDWNFVFHWPS